MGFAGGVKVASDSESTQADGIDSACAGAEGGLTTSHHYAGASATRDRRDRDDPSDALALFGRREEDG